MVWVDSLPEDFHDFLSADRTEGRKIYALATRELSRHPDNSPDSFEANAIRIALKRIKERGWARADVEGSPRGARVPC